VIHLPLCGFLERYMEPSQLHATQLLALSSMCVHHMTPPDAVEPLVKAIANHFVSDRSSPDAITVGINTIREICKRQPLAMNEDLLKDLAEYKNQRGDKGVIMAARALIQLYREVYPDLLPAKMRGSKAVATPDRKKPVYGAQHVFTDIPGLELLYQVAEGSQDGSNSDLSSLDSDSEDGEWVTDSDSEVDPDGIDGEFIDVTDADDNEECPQLVPAAGTKRGTSPPSAEGSAPTAKRPRTEDGPNTTASDDGEVESSGEEADESLSGEGSSEWEMDDEEEEEEEEGSEMEEEEEEEGSEREEGSAVDGGSEMESPKHATLSEALAGADGPWVVDTEGGSETSQRGTPSVASTGASHASISSSRVLSDADFEKIRKLQAQNGSHLSLRGKLKEREARSTSWCGSRSSRMGSTCCFIISSSSLSDLLYLRLMSFMFLFKTRSRFVVFFTIFSFCFSLEIDRPGSCSSPSPSSSSTDEIFGICMRKNRSAVRTIVVCLEKHALVMTSTVRSSHHTRRR